MSLERHETCFFLQVRFRRQRHLWREIHTWVSTPRFAVTAGERRNKYMSSQLKCKFGDDAVHPYFSARERVYVALTLLNDVIEVIHSLRNWLKKFCTPTPWRLERISPLRFRVSSWKHATAIDDANVHWRQQGCQWMHLPIVCSTLQNVLYEIQSLTMGLHVDPALLAPHAKIHTSESRKCAQDLGLFAQQHSKIS